MRRSDVSCLGADIIRKKIKIQKEITMIKSMHHGFGRAEVITKDRKITVELKSVNHRYLDLSIKMPRKLGFLEGAIRNLMKTVYAPRGKVDVFITYEDYTLSCGALKYNKELASEYMAYIRQMAEEFGIENDVKAGSFPLSGCSDYGGAVCRRGGALGSTGRPPSRSL